MKFTQSSARVAWVKFIWLTTLRLNRKVALKVLPAAVINDRERLRRFEQEAQAASALNHPNIITIHEIGVEGDTHFIATEYIEGETLRRRLQQTRLEIKETLIADCS